MAAWATGFCGGGEAIEFDEGGGWGWDAGCCKRFFLVEVVGCFAGDRHGIGGCSIADDLDGEEIDVFGFHVDFIRSRTEDEIRSLLFGENGNGCFSFFLSSSCGTLRKAVIEHDDSHVACNEGISLGDQTKK